MLKLINEFRKDVGKDFLVDIVQELVELLDVYLLEEFLDREPIMTKIDELRRKLDSSAAIPKSKQQQLHLLLKDINQNRHRVQTTLKRLADAEGEEHIIQIALEELLSEEQYLELDKALLEDELDSSCIVDFIKGMIVGKGLKFLP